MLPTSAYSLTNLPAGPGCPSTSHPTIFRRLLYPSGRGMQLLPRPEPYPEVGEPTQVVTRLRSLTR